MKPIEETEDETAEETLGSWLRAEYNFAEDRREILLNCLVLEFDLSAVAAASMAGELEALVVRYEELENKEEPS